MEGTMREYREAGVWAVAFGDIFLEDLRAYRERNLARVGMQGVFPIWHRDTTELVRTFIGLGFKASPASTGRSWARGSPGGRSTRRSSVTFPRRSIPAGRTASFIPSCTTGRSFAGRCP